MKSIKLLFLITFLSITPLSIYGEEYKTISKEDYLDKTRACILSQVAGVLSGFEFVGHSNPVIGMPDEWFELCGGPYGGGDPRGGAGENFVQAPGRILSDDDYHIDFFNQLIYDKMGAQPSHSDITDMWILHQVSDWGGGYSAMKIMNEQGYIPPFTGRLEYGNQFGWCTEAYIENETVGCVYPGMPATASIMTNRFASVTGDFESQLWGKFYGTAYSIAYFETDLIETLQKAAAVFHPGSWARQIYDLAFELHKKHPNDWRTAAKELEKYRRHIYLIDNIQTSYDVNGGFTILSLLYGNNDYYETMKIASLIGYDGDCTAATAAGLLGILQGMKALPEKINEVIYRDGEGVYVNNKNFVPHISKNYPDEQKFEDIILLYVKNAEKIIKHYGGNITDTEYQIKAQEVLPSRAFFIDNADFENGENNLHFIEKSGAQVGIANNIPAHNGDFFARILTNKKESEGKVFFKVSGLTPGKYYRLSSYMAGSGNNCVRMFAEGKNTPYTYASVHRSNKVWYYREMIFQSNDAEIEVGLHGINETGNTENFYLDDLLLEEYPLEKLAVFEAEDYVNVTQIAESTNASAGKYALLSASSPLNTLELTVNNTDDYLLRFRYANTTDEMITALLSTPEKTEGRIGFPATGTVTEFSGNYIDMPIRLSAGKNRISITNISGQLHLDKIELIATEEYGNQLTTSILTPEKKTTDLFSYWWNDSHTLTIDVKDNFPSWLSIYDLTGRIIEKTFINKNYETINLSAISSSFLILSLNYKNRMETKKLIIG